jgi:hypothetical protein
MEAFGVARPASAAANGPALGHKHRIGRYLTRIHLHAPRPFTQEITGSNPVGGTRQIAIDGGDFGPWIPVTCRAPSGVMESVLEAGWRSTGATAS